MKELNMNETQQLIYRDINLCNAWREMNYAVFLALLTSRRSNLFGRTFIQNSISTTNLNECSQVYLGINGLSYLAVALKIDGHAKKD